MTMKYIETNKLINDRMPMRVFHAFTGKPYNHHGSYCMKLFLFVNKL